MRSEQILLLFCVLSILVCGGVTAAYLQSTAEKKKFFVYRSRYVKLIDSLHSIATVANQLSSFIKELNSREVLDLFESSLTSLREILVATKEIPPFGKNLTYLEEAFKISQVNYKDLLRVQNLFRSDLTGRLLTFDEFKGFHAKTMLNGCYFCSKPTLDFNFVEAKIKLENITKTVKSCVFCHRALKLTGRANILYFENAGKLIHWQDLPSYRSLENFWELNRFKPQHKSRHLELV